MLILTRKVNETIFIGEDIRIVLVELKGSQARIGIACPEHITVMRKELGTRTKKNKWPNLSPDEIAYLVQRKEELAEWWLLPNSKLAKQERHVLEEFIEELSRWALADFIERYSEWYKEA